MNLTKFNHQNWGLSNGNKKKHEMNDYRPGDNQTNKQLMGSQQDQKGIAQATGQYIFS